MLTNGYANAYCMHSNYGPIFLDLFTRHVARVCHTTKICLCCLFHQTPHTNGVVGVAWMFTRTSQIYALACTYQPTLRNERAPSTANNVKPIKCVHPSSYCVCTQWKYKKFTELLNDNSWRRTRKIQNSISQIARSL